MQVTAYWDNELDPNYGRLARTWFSSWQYHGFDPIVLNEAHAVTHPKFAEIENKISSVPNLNSPLYARACFLRWLAYENSGRSGIFCDLDVINFSLTPKDLPPFSCDMLCLDSERSIACVYAAQPGVHDFVEHIRTFNPEGYEWQGRPHVDDMMLFWRWYTGPILQLCVKNSFESRLTSPLVHFQNDSVEAQHRFYNRWKAAESLAIERINANARG